MNERFNKMGAWAWALTLTVLAGPLAAQVSIEKPMLVKNINAESKVGFAIENRIDLGGVLIFTTLNTEGEYELWRSDGSVAGTRLIKGHLSANPQPTALKQSGVFVVDSASAGLQLWTTDGTQTGTAPIITIGLGSKIDGAFVKAQESLYFSAWDSAGLMTLWKTDGTRVGTLRLKDIPYRLSPFVAGGKFFFATQDSQTVWSLWKTDGTEAGTVHLKQLGDAYIVHGWSTDPNGNLLFVVSSKSDSRVLWRSDGTESGTIPLRTFVSGPDLRGLGELVHFRGATYFQAPASSTRIGWWKTDSTSAGTVLIEDFAPDSFFFSSQELNGNLFFGANDGTHGYELWRSDGTTTGTALIKDINPGSSHSWAGRFVALDGNLYFAAVDGTSGYELWRSDGTALGTVRVKDSFEGPGDSYPYPFISVGNVVLFTARDATGGYEFWRTDGTEAGTAPLKDIYPGPGDSSPSTPFLLEGAALFTASGESGLELWKTDGTTSGTTRLVQLATSSTGYPTFDGFKAGNQVFFSVINPMVGTELWRTDGTSAGTFRVKEAESGSDSDSSSPYGFAVFQNALHFVARSTDRIGLWKSDGTDSGTVLIKTLGSVGEETAVTQPVVFQGGLYFLVMSSVAPQIALWKSDGTESGTRLVSHVPEIGGNWNLSLVTTGESLFFGVSFAANGTNGASLWKSDGTSQGTAVVREFAGLDLGKQTLRNPTTGNETLFFAASDQATGTELWKSDGTQAGTVLVRDIRPGPEGSNPANLSELNGTLFFTESTEGLLWKSDGTEMGTVIVKSGVRYSGWPMIALADSLYFAAEDEGTGVELWRSDGTEAGTVRVKDIVPGPQSSYPRLLASANGVLFFLAIGETADGYFRQLWKTDGTEGGTTLVKSGLPRDSDREYGPNGIRSLGIGQMHFFTKRGSLWKSDGTEAGTSRFEGLYTDEPPWASLAALNGTLFLTAWGDFHGGELWKFGDGDRDGDGLPDWWEDRFFSGAANALDDPDLDGSANWEESGAGTDPTSANSVLHFSRIEIVAPEITRLEWASSPNQEYTLLRSGVLSTDPADFEVVRSRLWATPPLNTYLDTAATGRHANFYRLQLKE